MLPSAQCILVAEDEAITRLFLVTVLQGAGYPVLEACDGQEALQMAEHEGVEAITLLITDLRMPRMGGSELIRTLHRQCPSLKVLIVSASYTERVPTHLGVLPDHILHKPIIDTVLLRQVATVLAH